jgi:hypothetical protein
MRLRAGRAIEQAYETGWTAGSSVEDDHDGAVVDELDGVGFVNSVVADLQGNLARSER